MDEQYETNLNHSFYQDHSTSSSSFDANQPVDFRNDNQQANMPQLSSTHQLFEETPNIITSHDGLLEIIDPVSSRSSLTEVNLSRQPEFRTSNRIGGKQYFSQDNGLYRCEPCKTNFYDPQRYEAHIKIVHEEYKRPFKCQECGKAYKFEKNLLDHIADNHSNRPVVEHTCEICNKLYRSRTLLRSHMEKQHPEHNDEEEYNSGIAEQLKYQCQYCPKVFKSKYTFNYHSMSHHNHQVLRSKQFKCNECDTIFSCRSGLNQHKLSHLQYDERIKCDFEGCNVRFLKMDVKRRHIRLVHLKEKKHVCDICGESFGIMATLRHHRYIHTGEKPYTCYICGQAFRQRTAMKTHTKIHFPRTSKAKKLQKKH